MRPEPAAAAPAPGHLVRALRLLAVGLFLAGLVLGGIDLLRHGAHAAHGLTGGVLALVANAVAIGALVATRLAGPWAARAAALLLIAYAAVDLAAWHAGAEDCGCFGAFAVHPALTAAIALALGLGLLATAWPRDLERGAWLGCAAGGAAIVGVVVAASGLAAPAATAPLPAAPMEDLILAGVAARPAVEHHEVAPRAASEPRTPPTRVDADDPAQAPASLSQPTASDLDHGDWTLVLLRGDCERCRRFLAERGPLLETAMIAPGSTLLVIDLAAAHAPPDPRLPPMIQADLRRHAPVVAAARERFRHHQVPAAVRMMDGVAYEEDLVLRFGWRP